MFHNSGRGGAGLSSILAFLTPSLCVERDYSGANQFCGYGLMVKRSSAFPGNDFASVSSSPKMKSVVCLSRKTMHASEFRFMTFPFRQTLRPLFACALNTKLRDWRRSHQHALLFRRISNSTALVAESFAHGQSELLSRNSSRLHNFQ